MKNVLVSNLAELPYAMEEAVNRLRVNIGFLGEDVRKIMVISTFPNEGKSLVTMQLWRQMAEAGTKSVLVDIDMRNSVLMKEHPLVKQSEGHLYGTSDYLAGRAKLADVVCHTQIPAGDLMFNVENISNPSKLLESKRFGHMMDTLTKYYRYVFLDTPPLDLVSDGEAIGASCDGALLVVRSGVTPTKAVRASMAQLERSGCPILGIVLNRSDSSKAGYYTKRYGSYYGKSDGSYYYGSK